RCKRTFLLASMMNATSIATANRPATISGAQDCQRPRTRPNPAAVVSPNVRNNCTKTRASHGNTFTNTRALITAALGFLEMSPIHMPNQPNATNPVQNVMTLNVCDTICAKDGPIEELILAISKTPLVTCSP